MKYSRGALIIFFEKAMKTLCEHQEFWSIADADKSEQIIQLVLGQKDDLWRDTEWWRGVEEARRKAKEEKEKE